MCGCHTFDGPHRPFLPYLSTQLVFHSRTAPGHLFASRQPCRAAGSDTVPDRERSVVAESVKSVSTISSHLPPLTRQLTPRRYRAFPLLLQLPSVLPQILCPFPSPYTVTCSRHAHCRLRLSSSRDQLGGLWWRRRTWPRPDRLLRPQSTDRSRSPFSPTTWASIIVPTSPTSLPLPLLFRPTQRPRRRRRQQ